MTTDADMKIGYVVMLKELQGELDGMDGRRSALMATIAGLRRLIGEDEQQQLPGLNVAQVAPANGGKPAIPLGFFKGKTPTQAYRDLRKLWPGDYRPPQIADAFIAGGMSARTRTRLIQAVHSVLKREREKKAAKAAG